jgi:mycofactocin precursor
MDDITTTPEEQPEAEELSVEIIDIDGICGVY